MLSLPPLNSASWCDDQKCSWTFNTWSVSLDCVWPLTSRKPMFSFNDWMLSSGCLICGASKDQWMSNFCCRNMERVDINQCTMVHQSSSSYICLNDNCSMSEELVNWIIGLHALFICVSCVWIIAICSTFSRPITLAITVLVGFWGIQVSSDFIREVGRLRRAVALALLFWICFDSMILKESRNDLGGMIFNSYVITVC